MSHQPSAAAAASPRWVRPSKAPIPRSTIYRLQSDPTFPRIFKVSARVSLINLDELDVWIASQRQGGKA